MQVGPVLLAVAVAVAVAAWWTAPGQALAVDRLEGRSRPSEQGREPSRL